jgi:glycosyltransferase involved in cell wall biosynthesis
MKILFVIHQFYPEFRSGTEKFLLNLASMLQKAGHSAEVATYTFEETNGYSGAGEVLAREYFYNGIQVTALRHRKISVEVNNAPEDPHVHSFALDFLGRQKYDLVHIAHPMRMASFAKAARELGIPYLMTTTDFWTICPKIVLQTSSGDLCSGPEGGSACGKLCPELLPEFVSARLKANTALLANAAALVAPSRFVASILKKELPAANISVIPHGMDLRHVKRNPRVYGGADPIVFAYCGGLAPHKGAHTLIQAFRGVPCPSARLRLYGRSADETYLGTLKQLAGDDARVSFAGVYAEHETAEVFQSFDVLVIPSLCYESYSMVLQEAWACSVPVIASDLGSLGEKVRDGINGLKFAPGDQNDLSGKLAMVASRPEMLNDLKANIGRTAPPLVEEEAFLYERLYRSILSDKQPR